MIDEDEEYEPVWYPYERGRTVSEIGPEHGFILRDEEFGDAEDDEDADARVTMEQGRAENPGFFVTSTLYGWLFHTYRVIGGEPEAVAIYEASKTAMEELIDLLPYEEDRDIAGKARRLTEAIAEFEGRYS